MKRHLSALILLITSCASAQEISLFNGRDLSGWAGSQDYWSVKDGAITCKAGKQNLTKDQCDLVWKGGEVADFEFNCKVKMAELERSDFCNTGIYFRARIIDQATFRVSGYQADLVLKTQMPTVLGALAGELGAGEKMLTKTGQKVVIRDGGTIDVVESLGDGNALLVGFLSNHWNDCRVIAIGNRIQYFLNGKLTSEVRDERHSAPRSGVLALQGLVRKPMIAQFKDLKLRVVQGPSLATVVPPVGPMPVSIQTDATQPRIFVLKDQGPNAVEWALAPLEQTAPADIRQNLIYLREDLLDESKQKSKSSPAAYALGSQLCDKILAALDERAQASVRAGYTAAQADADVRVTSSQLEVRRNYMMSWPQYAREQDQRAEITRQQLSAADLKKERTKVEWSTRSRVLHKYLDDLYRQFREALR